MTVHLVVKHTRLDNDFLCRLQRHLRDVFGIDHPTIQVESSAAGNLCMLDDGYRGGP